MPRPTEENLREILRLAANVTRREPGFPHAHALLAGANVLFLDVGYERRDALTLAEPAARRALAIKPDLPGAHATLGSIAAHRGQWLASEAHFQRAFAHDDRTGRIHARHAQMILLSLGHIEAATRELQAEFRFTPTHARGAMQVAQALSMHSGRDADRQRSVENTFSIGGPAEGRDVRELYRRMARRAGRICGG